MSVAQTMATWGGSTVDNMESIEEDEAGREQARRRQQQQNHDDEEEDEDQEECDDGEGRFPWITCLELFLTISHLTYPQIR